MKIRRERIIFNSQFSTTQAFVVPLSLSLVIGFIFTAVNAARGGQPIVLPDRGVVALQSSSRAKIFGWLVVAATVALYIIFW